jgi:23S rRNA pseudouridine1911/1915/1917 synthase
MSTDGTALELEVDAEEVGQRLDRFLVARVPGMSRARARSLTADGRVRINGRRAKKGDRVGSGDQVRLDEPPPASAWAAEPDPDLPLRVVHEDARVVVVDKDAGVPSHPLRPGETGTVAQALLARYPEMAGVGYGPREPGLVHRLDTDTSGLLVAARDTDAFERLRASLRQGAFDKGYVALCAGRLGAPQIVDWPIATDRSHPRRVRVCRDPGEATRLRARPAETEVLEAEAVPGLPGGPFTYVTVRARMARRHQVRAHLAALGHPLAGDALYGGPALPGLDRHFLHASHLELPHPDGGVVKVTAPVPEALKALLSAPKAGY